MAKSRQPTILKRNQRRRPKFTLTKATNNFTKIQKKKRESIRVPANTPTHFPARNYSKESSFFLFNIKLRQQVIFGSSQYQKKKSLNFFSPLIFKFPSEKSISTHRVAVLVYSHFFRYQTKITIINQHSNSDI